MEVLFELGVHKFINSISSQWLHSVTQLTVNCLFYFVHLSRFF